MGSRDFSGSARLRRRGSVLVIVTVLATTVLVAGAFAAPTGSVKLNRCGYVTAKYGRSAVYPWQMTCAAADTVIKGSDNSHAKTIAFGPGVGGAAVQINGQYWVCLGQMGTYSCSYPYRPAKIHGVKAYKGPFTKAVEFDTCSLLGQQGCPKTVEFTQPPS